MEPKWLSPDLVTAIHGQATLEFGGLPGAPDAGSLRRALERPRTLYAYGGETSVYELAAAYCEDIVRYRPFADGNRRTSLLAVRAFLFLNGYSFEPDERDEGRAVVAVAAGQLDRADLARWISDYTTRRRPETASR